MQVPKQVDGQSPTGGMRRPRWGYPHPGQWWGHGWVHPPQYQYQYGDDASVHSALSGDSYSHFYNEYGVYPGAMPAAPMYQALLPPHIASPSDTSDTSNGGGESGNNDPSYYSTIDPYNSNHSLGSTPVWHVANANVAYTDGTNYIMHPATPCVHGSPHVALPMYQQPTVEEATEYNNTRCNDFYPTTEHSPYDPMHVPMSPFWGHLDHTTLAVMGLATPQGQQTPTATPSRLGQTEKGGACSNLRDPIKEGEEKQGEGYYNSVKPLVLRQSHYYGFGTVRSQPLFHIVMRILADFTPFLCTL